MDSKEKRYYWLKLKRDFFKRHDVKIIESMPNGKEYVLFYLKLLCESVDHNGNLRFSEKISYTQEMLATVTDTDGNIVKDAMAVFIELDLVRVESDGTYHMNGVSKMIGSAIDNDNAKRQQRYRDAHKGVTNSNEKVTPTVTKGNESKKTDTDKEKEKKKETQIDKFNRVKVDFGFSEPMESKLVEWFQYKSQIKKPYTSEIGIRNLLKKVEQAEQKHGSLRVMEIIDSSMASGYQGIVWDSLEKRQGKGKRDLLDEIWE